MRLQRDRLAVWAFRIGAVGLVCCLAACKTQKIMGVGTTTDQRTPPRPAELADSELFQPGTVNPTPANIIACAKKIAGDMRASPYLVNYDNPYRVIVDSKYFTVNTSSRFNRDYLVNMLRSELMKASRDENGKYFIRFVGREKEVMLEEEDDLDGVTSARPNRPDYRLSGSIEEMSENLGSRQYKSLLLTFDMMDIRANSDTKGEYVFNSSYLFTKARTGSSAYR